MKGALIGGIILEVSRVLFNYLRQELKSSAVSERKMKVHTIFI